MFLLISLVIGSQLGAKPVFADTSLSIVPTALPNAYIGTYYYQPLTLQNGASPVSWNINDGQLPVGLTLGTNGVIYGTPQYALTYQFTVLAADATGVHVSRLLVISVYPATATSTPVNVLPTSLPYATVGTWVGVTLSASGGQSPYTWSQSGGFLPPGVVFANNTLSGTPNAAGTYSFQIKALDVNGTYDLQNYVWVVNTQTSQTSELALRLSNLSRIGVAIHSLVKSPDDGNNTTQYDSAVYYIGTDGRRHAFPNARVYASWYVGFSSVQVLNTSDLASIPLGKNVTYKPGVRLVKFLSDPTVYAVDTNRVLRWVNNETTVRALYGSNWNQQVDDISDVFYNDYSIGSQIQSTNDYNSSTAQNSVQSVSDVLL